MIRLTPAEQVRIRQERRSGMSLRKIAEAHGISRDVAARVCRQGADRYCASCGIDMLLHDEETCSLIAQGEPLTTCTACRGQEISAFVRVFPK